MLNLNSVILFSEKPKSLAEFYKKILGVELDWSGGDFVRLKAGSGYWLLVRTAGSKEKIKIRRELCSTSKLPM